MAQAQDGQNKQKLRRDVGLDIFLLAPVIAGTGRTETDVATRLQRKVDHLSYCYANYITSGEPLQFKIRVRLTVLPSGPYLNF